MSFQSIDAVRLVDPVLTQLAQGYRNAEGVASFIAPAVPMTSRAGRTMVFGKDAFANLDLYRAPGALIQRVTTSYTTRSFALRQEAIGWEVTEEAALEARTNAGQIDLRRFAVNDAALKLMQSWEVQVAKEVLNPAAYEASCVGAAAGADAWDKPTSDTEMQIDAAKEAVREQIGVYPNKMVLSPQAYNAARRNKRIREYAQRGVIINEKVLAEIWGLDEVRVAARLSLNPVTGKLENIYNNCALLFYQTETSTDGLTPRESANYANAGFAYTYTLNGTPISTPERFDMERRVFRGDILVERNVELVGLGETGQVGSGYLFTTVVA